MHYVEPPTLDSSMRGSSEDGLDGLLKAYFQHELPQPWPTAPVPEERPVILTLPKARKSLLHSRLALAASVALFLAGPWLISGSFSLFKDNSEASTPDGTNVGKNLAKPDLERGSAKRNLDVSETRMSFPVKDGKARIQVDVLPPAKEDVKKSIKNQVKNMLD